MLAAVSHAAGNQEHSEYLPSRIDDNRLVIDPASPRLDLGPLYPRLDLDPLYPWPEHETPR